MSFVVKRYNSQQHRLSLLTCQTAKVEKGQGREGTGSSVRKSFSRKARYAWCDAHLLDERGGVLVSRINHTAQH